MLHLLNGDAATPLLRSLGLPGRVKVWREALSEGPAPPRWAERAAWLAGTGQVTAEGARAEWRRQQDLLASAAKEDEVVLWFDADLFCQANLAFLAAHLPEGPRLSVAAGTHARRTPDAVRAIFEARVPLPREAHAAAWRAFAADDPRALHDVPLAWIGRHLSRFPDAAGLGSLERRALEALAREGPLDAQALHEAIARGGYGEALGLTDVMVAQTLRELERGPTPLVARGEPTPLAREVLAGRADNVRARGVDRWLGGVALRGNGPVWRFVDGALALR